MAVRGLLAGCLAALAAVVGAEVIDPAVFGFAPGAPAATNAVALQKALEGGHRAVRVGKPGVYNLDRPVFLDDDTDLSFADGVVLQKAKCYSNVLVNRGAWQGTTNCNIRIDGLFIRVNGFDQSPPLESKAAGLRGHFAFYHIKNLTVTNYRILDVMGGQYAFHIADFDGVLLDGFDVRGNKDGIHINAGRHFVVRNGVTCTGDDGVALNANDWPSSSPCVGTIEDGLVENVVDLPGGKCNFARVLTGATPEWHAGIVLQRGETVRHGRNVYFVWMPVGTNTYVSTVAPTHTQGIWTDPSGLKFLYAQSDGCRTSSIRNVTFRNIKLQSNRGFGCFWDRGAWARSMHPEVPEADRPITQIAVDGLSSTGGCVFYGNSPCDLNLRNIRHPGDRPVISLGGYDDRVLENRVRLADSTFGEKGGLLVFKDPHTSAKVSITGCSPSNEVVRVLSHAGAQVSVSR